MKTIKTVVIIFQFIALYLVAYYIHIKYFKVDVVLYSVIIDGILAILAMMIVLYFSNYCKIYNSLEKFLLIVIMALSTITFSISIPTVIDRSLSFYILEKISQHGGSVRLSSMENIFINDYVKEHRLIDIRITEQIESKTIVVKDDCVYLTDFGKKLSIFSRFFRKNLLPKKRLIRGEYTDDLIDPFRSGKGDYDYQCNEV
jgi:hypothetical protein